MAGGGGGTTVSRAELPPELRPLFSGVGEQLLATQRAMPLSQFTLWNPGGVAGIAPLQQGALNLIPSTTQAPSGLNGLYGTTPGLNAATTGLYDIAGQTNPMQSALDTLSASGRVAPMQLASSPMSTAQFASSLPAMPSSTLFPGAPAVPQGAATGETPMMYAPPANNMHPSTIANLLTQARTQGQEAERQSFYQKLPGFFRGLSGAWE